MQLRLLAERGLHDHVLDTDALLAAARESETPQFIVLAFAAAVRLHAGRG